MYNSPKTLINTIWNGLCVCEYGGLMIHGWAYIIFGRTYIWNGLSVSQHVGLRFGRKGLRFGGKGLILRGAYVGGGGEF